MSYFVKSFMRYYVAISRSQRGWSLEPWSPEIFAVEPRAQSPPLLGARRKMLFRLNGALE